MSIGLLSILMLLTVILAKIVYNSLEIEHSFAGRERAFWAAEAGLEKGKSALNLSPGWYTDLPHLPEDDKEWLSSGAVGQDEGWFKLVREQGKNTLYTIGRERDVKVFLKIKFSFPPFKQLSWEEL